MAGHPGIVVRLLSWNLFHGRDFPPDPALLTWRSRLLRITERNATHAQVNRPLRDEFAGWLAGHPWDLALLQEAPPRWCPTLARRAGAEAALGLTARNSCARLRARLADFNPDLIASNEGGSNQLLARAGARIVEVRRLTLTLRPERRCMLWVRVTLTGGRGLAIGNLHATGGDARAAARDVELAAERAVEWAGGLPLVLGGDFNLRPRRDPEFFAWLAERFGLAAPTEPASIDHVLLSGLEVVAAPRALPPEAREVPGPDSLAIRLSDHAPVVASAGVR
jgi:endonuclease/exonuclease/phosphatase family metal-dependent hydrolase